MISKCIALLLLQLLLIANIFATKYYVDSQNGSDGNVGDSINPWKTIDRVNIAAFAPGDSILFKRGGVYRGTINPVYSGNSSFRITYTTYGSGPKPKFIASYNRGNPSDWTLIGGNVWASGFKEGTLGAENITNTGFETATSPWYTNSGGGVAGLTYTRVTTPVVAPYAGYYSAKIVVGNNNGSGVSDIQFIFDQINTKAVTWYKVQFAAKGSAPFKALAALFKAGSPYDNYILNTVFPPGQTWDPALPTLATSNPPEISIDTTWRLYTMYIQTNSKAAIAKGRFSLQMGNRLPENGTVFFDAFSFKECQTPVEYFRTIAEDPSEDVGNIIFTSGSSVNCGKKVFAAGNLANDKDFYYDYSNRLVMVYSASGNPATVFGDIELATAKMNIRVVGKSYLNFDNLDLWFGGGGGILTLAYRMGSNPIVTCSNINISDIDVSYVGGSRIGNPVTSTLRAGNGIGFWDGANNIVVQRCYINQAYDSGISPQGRLLGAVFNKMYFFNNVIDNCEQSFEIWQTAADTTGVGTSSMSEVYFDHNTCRNAGSSWAHTQRPDPKGVHLLFYDLANDVNFSNIYIRNNVFDNVTEYGIYCTFADKFSKITTIDYNCWNPGSSKPMMRVNYAPGNTSPSPTTYTWTTYRSTFGRDSNSLNSDPILLASGAIPIGSPAKDAGQNLGILPGAAMHVVPTDFINAIRPYNGIFDMGAFEYYP